MKALKVKRIIICWHLGLSTCKVYNVEIFLNFRVSLENFSSFQTCLLRFTWSINFIFFCHLINIKINTINFLIYDWEKEPWMFFIIRKCGNDSLIMLNMLRLFLITSDKFFKGVFSGNLSCCTHQNVENVFKTRVKLSQKIFYPF